ncbi:MAG: type II toxin-antitoxin system VapC family toxin, partial [Armatimonadota bacterium]
TKLTEVQSATRAITQLASLGFIKVVTSVDAINAAQNALRRVYGKRSSSMVRRLRKLLRANFHIVPTPSPERVQECLPEVLDPADALILSAARDADCFVLLTYNIRHFVKVRSIKVLTPKDFVEQVRKLLWLGFRP